MNDTSPSIEMARVRLYLRAAFSSASTWCVYVCVCVCVCVCTEILHMGNIGNIVRNIHDIPLFLWIPMIRRFFLSSRNFSRCVHVCSFLLVRHIDVVIRNRYSKEYYASEYL